MTKEDLKYEAEQYSYDVPIYQIEQQLETIQKAYLAAAEPREKRIKELEESLLDIAKQSAKQIDELKKENTELKAKNKWYSEQVCNKECAEVWGNLTKATDLLKWFVWYFREGSPNLVPYKHKVAETEQFISKVEK